MKYLYSICFLFYGNLSLAQVDFTKDYYPQIYKAEAAIVEEDYPEALQNYQAAFSNVSKPFARDYLNAAFTALKTENTTAALQYCDSLMAKGVGKEFFVGHTTLSPLWQTEGGKNFLSTFETKHLSLNKGRDTSLAKLFKAMAELDQEFRRKPNAYKAYADTIRKIDSLNIGQLREIIKQHGFPNENMVNVVNPVSNSLPASIVFHHYCQSLSINREGKYNFLQDFAEAVRKGELDPHQLAFLISLQNEKSVELGGWGLMACVLNGVRSKLVGVRYGEEKQKQVDRQRIVYGLEPLAEYYQKAVFAIRSEKAKEFAFGIYRTINAFEMGSEAECKQFLEASLSLE